jgi:hypothetical protein
MHKRTVEMVEALYNTNKVIVTSKLWWHCGCPYVFLSFKVLWSSGHLDTHLSVLSSLATINLIFLILRCWEYMWLRHIYHFLRVLHQLLASLQWWQTTIICWYGSSLNFSWFLSCNCKHKAKHIFLFRPQTVYLMALTTILAGWKPEPGWGYKWWTGDFWWTPAANSAIEIETGGWKPRLGDQHDAVKWSCRDQRL